MFSVVWHIWAMERVLAAPYTLSNSLTAHIALLLTVAMAPTPATISTTIARTQTLLLSQMAIWESVKLPMIAHIVAVISETHMQKFLSRNLRSLVSRFSNTLHPNFSRGRLLRTLLNKFPDDFSEIVKITVSESRVGRRLRNGV